MLSSAAQGRFAAEFATFLVAMAGLSLVDLRPELLSRSWWPRTLLLVGFAAVGMAAFLQGSTLVADRGSDLTGVVQGLGLVAVAAGTLHWSGDRAPRRAVQGGIVVMAVALALTRVHRTTAADATLAVGAVVVGAGLITASRRSVAARVAASAAGTLLVVVLVLSVALSTVLADKIDTEQERRLTERGLIEQGLAETAASTNALVIDRTASLLLSASTQTATEIAALAISAKPQLSAKLSSFLGDIRPALNKDVSLIYVSQAGVILGLSLAGGLDQATLAGMVGSAPVQQVISKGVISHDDERSSVEVIGATAVAVGVDPVAIRDASTLLPIYPGILLAVQPLDKAYLTVRRDATGRSAKDPDPDLSLALVTRTAVLSQSGTTIDRSTLVGLANEVFNSTTRVPARQVGNRFYAAIAVNAADQTPVMALVTSTSITVVTDTRNSLFRILFLIALGGTLLALLLAAVVGERIGAGLRTLTAAAQRIQRGEFAEPSGVRADDEVGVLGAAFDSMASSISAQTAALQQAAVDETALRNQLEAVVAGMGEALVAVDAAGKITLVNRAAEELLDIEGANAVGQWVDDVIIAAADDGTDLVGRLRRPSLSRWATTVTLIPERGSAIPAAISAGALRGPAGELAGAVFVLRDLRPERAVERMKSEFLSRVGHELRTPLTAILGYADILLRRPVPEEKARQFYDEIYEGGKRLSRIVEMLEFSAAAEAGRSLMRPDQLSVRSLVEGVLADWNGRLNGNHRVARRVARGLPDITGDRRWLALSLNELIDNAVKFSPDGGRIGVVATAVERGGRPVVEISVIDQGVGMSDADVELAFTEFTQGDSSDTRRFGGLGLGLSLVKRVAEAHGGTVTCTSTPHKGSKFSIVLPT